ncbi:MAG TPA: type I methionyl aminopeptidase [Chitinophagaceae bacterium]|nr:type I methionyl aminopeptidase [Chitinophagaceae bacterium]
MISYKTPDEIARIRKSATLVSAALAEVAAFLRPGITTASIDQLAENFILGHSAIPSFKDYQGFPCATCISVNEAVVHGIPGNYQLRDRDIVSVDVGVYLNGYHGDSAYTFAIGDVPEAVLKLMGDTKRSLYAGIAMARAGNRVGDISYAIQQFTEIDRGYGVVRDLVGHGLGKKLHEDPQVPNFGRRGTGPKLKEGLVIAIEPMINLGTREVSYQKDGWTVVTRDGQPSAHYEHTVLIRQGEAEILSSFRETEAAEIANTALNHHY